MHCSYPECTVTEPHGHLTIYDDVLPPCSQCAPKVEALTLCDRLRAELDRKDAAMVAAAKDLHAQRQALKARIAALEAANGRLIAALKRAKWLIDTNIDICPENDSRAGGHP